MESEDCANCVNFCNVDSSIYIGEENRTILAEPCRNCIQKVADYMGEAEQLIEYVLEDNFKSIDEVKDYICDVFSEYITDPEVKPINRGNGEKDLFGYSVPEVSDPPTAW